MLMVGACVHCPVMNNAQLLHVSVHVIITRITQLLVLLTTLFAEAPG